MLQIKEYIEIIENEKKISFYFNKKQVAYFENNNLTFINDNLNSIRSFSFKRQIIEFINKEISYYHSYCNEEDMNINAINTLLNIKNKNIEDLKNEDLEYINALLYTYNNIWVDCRNSLNIRLLKFFNNPSNYESDLLTALLFKGNTDLIFSLVEDLKYIKLNTSKEKFISFFNNFEQERNEYFENFDKANYFSDIDSVKKYFSEYH